MPQRPVPSVRGPGRRLMSLKTRFIYGNSALCAGVRAVFWWRSRPVSVPDAVETGARKAPNSLVGPAKGLAGPTASSDVRSLMSPIDCCCLPLQSLAVNEFKRKGSR